MRAWLQRFDRAEILLPITMACWAGNIIIGRAVRGDISPISLSFIRWGVALCVILPFALPHLRRDWRMIRAHMPIMLLLSLAGVGCYNTIFYYGLTMAPALNALILQSTMPVIIIVFGALFYGDRASPTMLLGVALSMAGALVIVLRGDMGALAQLQPGLGEMIMILALMTYGVYSVGLPKRPTMHPFSFIAATFFIGNLFLLPLFVWERATYGAIPLTPETLGAFAYVGVFPSLIAYLCFNRGVQLVGSTGASPYFHLIPLFGAILAVMFLDESLAGFHLVGGALVTAGLALATMRR